MFCLRLLTALKFKKFDVITSKMISFNIMKYSQAGFRMFPVKIAQDIPKVYILQIVIFRIFCKKQMVVSINMLHND